MSVSLRLTLTGLAVLAGCAPRGPGLQAIRDSVTASSQRMATAFSALDATGFAGGYHENGMILPPNVPARTGRIDIQAFALEMMNAGATGLRLETTEVEGEDELAFERGRYAVTGAGGAVVDSGKYVAVWKRDGYRWQLYRDIWNSNIPINPIPPTPVH